MACPLAEEISRTGCRSSACIPYLYGYITREGDMAWPFPSKADELLNTHRLLLPDQQTLPGLDVLDLW
jgi:hypothetical protein